MLTIRTTKSECFSGILWQAITNSLHSTPHSFAWGIILAKNVSPRQQNQMASLFPDVYASNQFPRLHELVLDLKSGNLDLETKRVGFNIDAQDAEGNTALQWACLRGDAKITQWLLLRGADPNIPNHNIGRTALMAACTSVSLPCIKLLLEHDVDINVGTHGGLDALIYLVEEDRNPQPISDIVQAARLLIEHGISLEPHGLNQVWCLARAARTEMDEVMDLILDQGVDINRQNKFGLTALARSIAWSAHRSAKFLLKRGASYTGVVKTDVDGRTLLHHAALNPSIAMVKVLIEARLTGIDPEIMDKEGFTAEDYLNRAQSHFEEFALAFRQLLSDVRARCKVPTETEDADYEDTFFDALEGLQPTEDTEYEDIFFDALEGLQPTEDTEYEDTFFDALEGLQPTISEMLD
jgi:ankyrin repeat protein